jgi:hypothetical protein
MNKYVQPRPYADPDVAARKIEAIAQDDWIYVFSAVVMAATLGMLCIVV